VPRSIRGGRGPSGPTTGGDFAVRVVGAEELARVSKALRQAGAKDMRNELTRAMRAAAKPLIAEARQHARETLPKRGGLNKRVARSSIRAKIRTGGQSVGVRIVAKGLDARVDTAGRVRHPVFGNRKVWVQQQVKPGWFDVPMKSGAPEVRRELLKAIDNITRKLEGA
jgi:hypothetical protein